MKDKLEELHEVVTQELLARVRSPKSCAFPLELILINSIALLVDGLAPEPKTIRVFEHPLPPRLTPIVTAFPPKSTAFPSDAIVI